MKQDIYVYFIGTAGSGKSTLTASFKDWLQLRGLDAITVNLDPGAEKLPYEPDVDLRDWISLKEIMETHDLGPNGAQIACADMIALNIDEIKESISPFKSDYILLDTPGQLELFVFRESGKYTVGALRPEKSIVGYLIDPTLAHSSSGYVSQLLLALTASFRVNQPQINLLHKADLLSEEQRDIIKQWSENSEILYESILNEEKSIYREMSQQICRLLQDFGGYTSLIPTSREEFFGLEDLYTTIQMQFEGGEDLLKD